MIYMGIFSKLLVSLVHFMGSKEMETTVPNIANQLHEWLWCYGWDVMDHCPHKPYFTPSDFSLIGLLKKHQAGKNFVVDANITQAVTSWLQTLDSNFFYAGI